MRYGRQMLVTEIGNEGQLKLKKSKVMVIGAGGLGCPILQYLAVSGIGTLGAVDFDKIELHNLHRQILYGEGEVGASKIQTALQALGKLNPHTAYRFTEAKIDTHNVIDLLRGFDLVIDGSDNFATRYLINDSCVQLGIPLIYGSILNFKAQFSVFNHQGSKNLRDLFAEAPDPLTVPNCAVNGVLSTFPGLIGMMMAQEALKLLMGLPVLHNEFVLLDTLDWQWTKLKF